MSLLTGYLLAGSVIGCMGFLLWLTSLALKDASIVDPFWSLFFLAAMLVDPVLFRDGLPEPRALLLLLMEVCWSLRLAVFLALRNWGKGEDFRYRAWRQKGGAAWWWASYFKVFLLQGLIAWIICIPLLAALHGNAGDRLTWVDGLGALLWLLGFGFEVVGDHQLWRHRRDPARKGRVLSSGLWRYSRHPNYFGEACLWWGYYVVAVASGAWWTFYAPLLMTFLLLKVSGVALLEKTLTSDRPDYAAYKRTTPAFFPWFPRTEK